MKQIIAMKNFIDSLDFDYKENCKNTLDILAEEFYIPDDIKFFKKSIDFDFTNVVKEDLNCECGGIINFKDNYYSIAFHKSGLNSFFHMGKIDDKEEFIYFLNKLKHYLKENEITFKQSEFNLNISDTVQK